MSVPKVTVKKDNSTDTWFIDYRYDGCRRRPRIGTDKGEAEKIAFEIRQHLMQGKDPELEMTRADNKERARNLKLKEFWFVFAEDHLPTLRPNTQALYRYLMETISNYPIAVLPLVQINRLVIAQYQKQRKGKASPATINREVQLIKSMLGRAYEWEILERDPRPGMKLLKEHNRRDVSNIKPEQITALFESLPDSISNICEVALFTGFRKETIVGMMISQVQLPDIGDNGTVRFEGKGGDHLVKNVGPQAVKILREAIGNRTEGYVFLSPNNGVYSTIHKTFDRHVRKLGINIACGRKLCFHDLRRLYATWMLNAGWSLDKVRDALDHKDRSTTDRYAKFIGGGEVFEPVLGRNGEKLSKSGQDLVSNGVIE